MGCLGHTRPEEGTNAKSHAVALLLSQGCCAPGGGTKAEPFLNYSLLPGPEGLWWHSQGRDGAPQRAGFIA